MLNSLYKKEKSLLALSSAVLILCFIVCHITFSYYSRLESDDYTFLAYLRDKGFFGTIKFIYFSWEGAFGVVFVSLLKIKFTMLFHSIFIHNIACTIITFYCIYYFINTIFFKYFQISERYYAIVLTTLIYSNLYYDDLAINDTWYWLCGSIYLFMPAVLLFFTAVLIRKENKFLIIIAYIYFFLYGASRLNYAAILISILGFLFIYYWFRKKTFNKTLFSLCLVTLVALVIYVIAPGNYIRRSEELTHTLTLMDYAIGPFKLAFWFIYNYCILKLPFHILFMLPAFFVGFLLREKIEKYLPSNKQMFRVIIGIIVFCAFCIYLQSLSMFVAKGSQTARTLEMLSIITVLCILTCFIILGSKIKAQKFILAASIICSLGASMFLLRRIYICYPVIKKYSVAVDERHQTIEKALVNFTGDTLVLKKLPPASWLHSGELKKRAGKDPMNNVFLEGYYRPKFFLDIED